MGNLNTLKEQNGQPLREALIEFYNRFYSANVMTLVVIDNKPLDEMEKIIVPRFSPVKNLQRDVPETTEKIFANGVLPKTVYMIYKTTSFLSFRLSSDIQAVRF